LIRVSRESDTKLGDVFGANTNTVKTIGDVDFDELHGAGSWVSHDDVT
jgi:hypothetical protein